jgi:hypothetical protein
MSKNDPSDGPDTDRALDLSIVPDVAGPSSRRTWIIAVVAAIGAGLGSWGVVEGVLNAYTPAFQSRTSPYPTAEEIARITRARIACETITFAATGGLLGLVLGLAGGISRRSIKWATLAGLLGLVVGGLAEAGSAYGTLQFIYTKIDVQSEDLLQSMLSHLALWAVIGLAGGLAFGLGLGGRGAWWKAAAGGLVGFALATVAYELIGALVLPTDGTHQPFGDSARSRVLAQVLITLGAAIGAVAATSDRAKRPASA